jgi:hypothetical protein
MLTRLRAALVFVVVISAAIGCSSNIKPAGSLMQRPRAPTADSIRELFDVVQLDNIVGELIDFEKARLRAKLQGARAKSRLTPAQQQVRDEFVAKMLAVLDEEFSIERVRQLLLVTFQQSFSQQDIDAVTAFYRTKAGKSVLARYPQAFRAYEKQKLAANDAGRKPGGDTLSQDSLPPTWGLFFKPWETPGVAEFFDSDIGKDIIARWPAAAQKYYEETEAVEEEVQTRLRNLTIEYQAKVKSAGSKEYCLLHGVVRSRGWRRGRWGIDAEVSNETTR